MSFQQVNALEFNEIKAQIKDYLKSQSQFSDYDFEGSSMTVLLDCLLYTSPSPRDKRQSRMPSSA